ncbi:MAG TPA: hypothetical protein VL173_01990 [Vicinamibacterales bacterium]|jgi:hypothetical protein|nr:hypothetical protein [Vicinamibacterales bacterium]
MRCSASVFAAVILLPVGAFAADLRITDSRGREVVVSNAIVNYGSLLTVDEDKDGIRVEQGDGVVRLKWQDVDAIAVTKVDTTAKPARVELDVALKNGKHVPATLFRQGAMKLTGRSDLGDYSVDLDKIRRIAPVK